MTPPPASQPNILFEDETLPSVPPSICERMRPRPPTTYGRTPPPFVPPMGTPMIRLPIRSITVLLPKSLFVPKKLGLHPKSASPPMMPAPIPPALTPTVACPFWMLLPNADPTHGVTNPSARACIGASTTAAAEAKMRDLITLFIRLLLRLPAIASDVPLIYGRGIFSRATRGRRAVRRPATHRTQVRRGRQWRLSGERRRLRTASTDRRSEENLRSPET